MLKFGSSGACLQRMELQDHETRMHTRKMMVVVKTMAHKHTQ